MHLQGMPSRQYVHRHLCLLLHLDLSTSACPNTRTRTHHTQSAGTHAFILLNICPAVEFGVTEVHGLAPFDLDLLVVLQRLICALSRGRGPGAAHPARLSVGFAAMHPPDVCEIVRLRHAVAARLRGRRRYWGRLDSSLGGRLGRRCHRSLRWSLRWSLRRSRLRRFGRCRLRRLSLRCRLSLRRLGLSRWLLRRRGRVVQHLRRPADLHLLLLHPKGVLGRKRRCLLIHLLVRRWRHLHVCVRTTRLLVPCISALCMSCL